MLLTPYNLLKLVWRLFSESATALPLKLLVCDLTAARPLNCLDTDACPNLSIFLTSAVGKKTQREAIREQGDEGYGDDGAGEYSGIPSSFMILI